MISGRMTYLEELWFPDLSAGGRFRCKDNYSVDRPCSNDNVVSYGWHWAGEMLYRSHRDS